MNKKLKTVEACVGIMAIVSSVVIVKNILKKDHKYKELADEVRENREEIIALWTHMDEAVENIGNMSVERVGYGICKSTKGLN